MKEFSNRIKNQIKAFTPFKRCNPHVYWNSLIYVFLVAILILIVFSFYLLFKIKNQQILQITPATTETPSLINEKLLKKVNESFDAKLVKQKEVQSGLNTYEDPSIN